MWLHHKSGTSEHLLVVDVYRHSARLLLQVLTLFILGIASLYVYLASSHGQIAQAKSVPTPRTVAKPVVVAPAQQPTNTPAATVSATAATTAAVPTCIPDSLYRAPVPLAAQQPGIQQIIDTPSNYAVYGTTPAQIMAQMARCTPVHSTGTGGAPGKFAASTANAISWHVSYSDVGTGLCTITGVSVSLHINQVFPLWQPTSGSSATLARLWQDYSNKLHAYEQGHVQLDVAAAATILSDLQTLPVTACSDIAQAANTKALADIARNNTANTNYDIVNNFGLKQGVVL